VSLNVFAVVRGISEYGNMFLLRSDKTWQQWMHVSKYPPSLTYYSLELEILFLCLAFLRTLELRIGVRENASMSSDVLLHRPPPRIRGACHLVRSSRLGWAWRNLWNGRRSAPVALSGMPLWYRRVKAGAPQVHSQVSVGTTSPTLLRPVNSYSSHGCDRFLVLA
jgi:hypothetical protein